MNIYFQHNVIQLVLNLNSLLPTILLLTRNNASAKMVHYRREKPNRRDFGHGRLCWAKCPSVTKQEASPQEPTGKEPEATQC